MGPVVGTEAKVQKGEETGGEETVRWGEGERDTESRSQKGREKKEETERLQERGRQDWVEGMAGDPRHREGQYRMVPDPVRLVEWGAALGSLEKVTEPV